MALLRTPEQSTPADSPFRDRRNGLDLNADGASSPADGAAHCRRNAPEAGATDISRLLLVSRGIGPGPAVSAPLHRGGRLLASRNRRFPSPFSRLLAARALDGSGKQDDAAKMYAEFEREARTQISQPDNSNRELIGYYIDVAHQPQEALRIARLELENCQDWRTLTLMRGPSLPMEIPPKRTNKSKSSCRWHRRCRDFYHAGAIEAAAGNRSGQSVIFSNRSISTPPRSGGTSRRGVNQSGNYTAVRYTRDSSRQ